MHYMTVLFILFIYLRPFALTSAQIFLYCLYLSCKDALYNSYFFCNSLIIDSPLLALSFGDSLKCHFYIILVTHVSTASRLQATLSHKLFGISRLHFPLITKHFQTNFQHSCKLLRLIVQNISIRDVEL